MRRSVRKRPPAKVIVNYVNLRVKCGKQACRCARTGFGHGPYWYAFWNDPRTKKKRSFYLGKRFMPPLARGRSPVHRSRRTPPK